MRALLLLMIFILAGVFALWQFNLIRFPFAQPKPSPEEQATSSLFNVVKTGDLSAVITQLEAGANLNVKDQYGQTPLMYASGENANPEVIRMLLKAGADINMQTDAGWTALMYAARDAKQLEIPILLMNAGADPTLRNTEGQSVVDVAGISVRSSPLYRRLEELVNKPFDSNWPSGYIVPIKDATLSSRKEHLPGALRAYRNGTHEGFDFYSGVVSVPITFGTPIQAIAEGEVIRADHNYVELTQEGYDQIIEASKNSLVTPLELLDKLRGRQVWIQHPGGFISRYAHLSAIPATIVLGAYLKQGETIGQTGNSGTLEAVQGTQDGPHPHIEIWKGDRYLGQGLEPTQIYDLAAQVFGEKARPPYVE